MKEAYLIIDIGTGNVRVAVANVKGEVISVERDNVHYKKDELYANALSFNPDELWEQIIALTKKVLHNHPDLDMTAITASSQREGVVLLGPEGESLIGLPNHDHRGREWENAISDSDKTYVYQLAGRYPSSLFSAMKLIGLKNKHPELYERVTTMVSISDWAQYKLTGIKGYEPSQASETLLYDVEKKSWSKGLCTIFGISENILPDLRLSGTVLGKILPEYADSLNISPEVIVIVGGADTQLAIKSTQPSVDDIVIVSGTTTPVVKIINEYKVDQHQRTWTNRHIERDTFILETNAGVTGLNYQRLKEVFYPNEGYEVIEKELSELSGKPQCVASLGSLIADEKSPLTKGGFIFDAPVSDQLTRACFVWAALWDIACCIKENFDSLCDVTPYHQDYVWACGGGLQSGILRQFIASLTNKKIQLREGYKQASVSGGALICNELLVKNEHVDTEITITFPKDLEYYNSLYKEWKKVRSGFKQIF
ncbi:MAG: FGGY family carbohydrate kinase [Ginsengibacter sp.]